VYRYNLLEEGGWYVGAHLNYLQMNGGIIPNPRVVFNTFVQHPSLAGADFIQMGQFWSPGTLTDGEVGNNTLMALPDGTANLAANAMVWLGVRNGDPGTATGNAHDNYMDATSAYLPFYGGLVGFTYTNNINLKNGAVLPGP
jgi:hypothetical protein